MSIAHLSDIQRDMQTDEFTQELYDEHMLANQSRLATYDDVINCLEDIKTNLEICNTKLNEINQYSMASECKTMLEDIDTNIAYLQVDKNELEGDYEQ